MHRRFLLTLLFAFLGALILVSLGAWQLQRHQWKQDILTRIETEIAAEPVALPDNPDAARDAFRPVRVEGRIGDAEILVQSSMKLVGAGYRVIAPFETADGRRILIDRGFIPQSARDAARPGGPAMILGNLHWPDELDMFTPDPDRASSLWFARDVPGLSAALDTEPVFVVVRETTLPAESLEPLPLDSAGIPDNHLGYAIQWFLMAVAWVAMAGVFLRGQLRGEGKGGDA